MNIAANSPSLQEDGIEIVGVEESVFTLKDIFRMIMEGKPLDIEQETLQRILQTELVTGGYFSQKPRMKVILTFMLVVYIRNWNGWKCIRKKQYEFPEIYAKFLLYLKFKVNYFVMHDYRAGCQLYSLARKNSQPGTTGRFKDISTQTDNDSILAPFSVSVSANPKILNSISVSEINVKVMIWKSSVQSSWTVLTLRQLINWPFVKMELSTKYLKIVRANDNEHNRYIFRTGCTIPASNTKEFITNVEIVDKDALRKVYKINVLKEYFNVLMAALMRDQTRLHVGNELIADIITFFETIFEDIIEIGFENTIATNTSVVFNIGKNTFKRCRRHNGKQEVNYIETITPRVNLLLASFTGFNETSKEPFRDIHNSLPDSNVEFKYSCSFCDSDFPTKNALLLHFINLHSMEQPVTCVKCERMIIVKDLSEKRWQHDCVTPPNN